MKLRHLAFAPANFLAVVVLLSLLTMPFYFARNLAKVENVAGVKTIAPYQLNFQTENFPNLVFSQEGEQYQISFTKVGPIQAYLGMGILTNQTNTQHTYQLQNQSQTKVFFGQNLEDQKDQISLDSSASIEISIFSPQEAPASSQTVEFNVEAK